jgi:hypothetical protein
MTMTPDEIKAEAEELAARLLTLANAAAMIGQRTGAAIAAAYRGGQDESRDAIADWLEQGAKLGAPEWAGLEFVAGQIRLNEHLMSDECPRPRRRPRGGRVSHSRR